MPDVYHELMKRYKLLSMIGQYQPIGRRTLSKKLAMSETILRKEIEVLKAQKLIAIHQNGMSLTAKGEETISELTLLIREKESLEVSEKELADVLGIEKCIIVPGNVDTDFSAFELLGKKASHLVEHSIAEGAHTVAVSGGSTLKMVASQMEETPQVADDLLFVSARGGMNDEPSLEANIIAQTMAEKTHGKSRSLYAPNYVQPQLYASLVNIPEIYQTLQLVEKASIVLYSIGEPIQMAKRRRLPQEVIDYLIEKKVVAEAFGEFINEKGEVIYKLSNVGLQFEALASVPHVIIVSGGIKKAQAIKAHMKLSPAHAWLVTDEAAAQWILKGE